MTLKHRIRKLLWKFGCDLTRISPNTHPIARRKIILRNFEIDVVLDVGANSGQYASNLRENAGFSKRIVSFEPLSSAFQLLSVNAAKDSKWQVFNYALGNLEGEKKINIAGNSTSSSFLDMLPRHSEAAPYSKYVSNERVRLCKLDSVFSELCEEGENVYLKIDAQGYERNILLGAETSLSGINFIQLEMSLVHLYEKDFLFKDLMLFLEDRGYSLFALEPGFIDPKTGQMLQVDGIFFNEQ